MGGLQVAIGLVLRIPDPVVLERLDLDRRVLADVAIATAVLVDVVARVGNQVEALLGHVLERAVIAGFVALAPRHSKRERLDRVLRGGGARAAHRAHGVAGHEAIEVVAPRLEPGGIHVHAVAQLRGGGGAALLDHPAEGVVVGQFPADCRAHGVHAVSRDQRIGREPRPEHHAGGRGVARGDAEREGIGLKGGPQADTPVGGDDGGEGSVAGKVEKGATVHQQVLAREARQICDRGGHRARAVKRPLRLHPGALAM